jgi:hypothetical protein
MPNSLFSSNSQWISAGKKKGCSYSKVFCPCDLVMKPKGILDEYCCKICYRNKNPDIPVEEMEIKSLKCGNCTTLYKDWKLPSAHVCTVCTLFWVRYSLLLLLLLASLLVLHASPYLIFCPLSLFSFVPLLPILQREAFVVRDAEFSPTTSFFTATDAIGAR